jgi:hypothetical protein
MQGSCGRLLHHLGVLSGKGIPSFFHPPPQKLKCHCSVPSMNVEEPGYRFATMEPERIRAPSTPEAMTGMPSTSPLALNPGIVEPRRPRKRPQPMPIPRGTAWNDLRALRDRSPVTCETSWKPPGRHLDSSIDESTGQKSKTTQDIQTCAPPCPRHFLPILPG